MPHVRFFCHRGSGSWWVRESLRTGISTLKIGRFGVHYWTGPR